MDWKEIVTALVTVVTALGGWEAVRYLINRKSNARKARAEAKAGEVDADKVDANAYIETAAAQFALLKDTNEFLQQQLKDKEVRFAEQTDLLRDTNKKYFDLLKDYGKLELKEQKFHCEVKGCLNREPPNGY